jgi:hypothetical protein
MPFDERLFFGATMKPHRGTMILVLGILSIVCCGPLGIAAWLMGSSDLKAMAAGEMDPSGQSHTNIGKILGIIGTAFLVLGIIWMVFMGGLGAMSAARGGN